MKKILAFILVLVLALSLVACGKGGETPNGNSPTPGTVTETPNGGDVATPEKKNPPTWADSSRYDMKMKAHIDEGIAFQFGSEIDVDKLISEVIVEYGEFIDERITPEAIRMATILGREDAVEKQNYKSVTGLPGSSLKKANDFLQSKGKEPIGSIEWADLSNPDEQTAKNSIAALAIAASLFYETNRGGYGDLLWDLGKAFDDAYAYTGDSKTVGLVGGFIMNNYYVK